LLFFAFAGYARIATMGEEVREPQRTIPRAVLVALAVTVAVYAVVALTLLRTLGLVRLARSTAPLADVVHAAGWSWAAMAREHDLPGRLAAVHPRYRVPHRAEITSGLAVCLLVAVTDPRSAIGFSSFGVLVYYLVANMSAFTQSTPHRLYPRWSNALGALLCVVLVSTLPGQAVMVGLVVLAFGAVFRTLLRRGDARGQ
jgi:APA family basic amino acid/polyamine antiporter